MFAQENIERIIFFVQEILEEMSETIFQFHNITTVFGCWDFGILRFVEENIGRTISEIIRNWDLYRKIFQFHNIGYFETCSGKYWKKISETIFQFRNITTVFGYCNFCICTRK